ncbi:hypothetical protein LOAG_09043 [Loa loa]|uniref:Uncharacterized protein n=1 Tax=Loa loa TaxID=7209 RepID=A0A1S0TU88_LOALO|nr:hypothetical protein LOAG_09043 [Loa loa]EFO19449.1 hypothetical protein LOAG_09043 [Loa loa]
MKFVFNEAAMNSREFLSNDEKRQYKNTTAELNRSGPKENPWHYLES